MNNNIRIAKELVRIARDLVADDASSDISKLKEIAQGLSNEDVEKLKGVVENSNDSAAKNFVKSIDAGFNFRRNRSLTASRNMTAGFLENVQKKLGKAIPLSSLAAILIGLSSEAKAANGGLFNEKEAKKYYEQVFAEIDSSFVRGKKNAFRQGFELTYDYLDKECDPSFTSGDKFEFDTIHGKHIEGVFVKCDDDTIYYKVKNSNRIQTMPLEDFDEEIQMIFSSKKRNEFISKQAKEAGQEEMNSFIRSFSKSIQYPNHNLGYGI